MCRGYLCLVLFNTVSLHYKLMIKHCIIFVAPGLYVGIRISTCFGRFHTNICKDNVHEIYNSGSKDY